MSSNGLQVDALLQRIGAVGKWLDSAFQNPRSPFDVRLLPPPTNELIVEFQGGERSTVFFSGGGTGARAARLRRIRGHGVYVVQYKGAAYTINTLPRLLAAYLDFDVDDPLELKPDETEGTDG